MYFKGGEQGYDIGKKVCFLKCFFLSTVGDMNLITNIKHIISPVIIT